VILAPARAEHAQVLATAHGRSFDPAWSAEDIEILLSAPGGFGWAAWEADLSGPVCGFLLARAIAGEAEILTLAIDPAHRRQGVARALVEASAGVAIAAGAEAMFLEVAADNPAAIGLYRSAGFEPVGSRKGYYPRPGSPPIDALVLRRTLNSRAG
jgi:ribosomal-protein-alanine N-acetyltransferase